MESTLALLIPVLALATGFVAVVIGGLYKVRQWKAQDGGLRLQGNAAPEILAQLDDLRDELQQVRAELVEVQERMDFTERLLANPPARTAPPGAKD